ncbi:LysR family transcriptional regulator [Bifidobacterium eulemuris]|uniref:Transcriptional regulator n=1 Tax=Bifidobacterium eulemuris TaxID=1765219 RepID=A0A261GDY4_9BIFI|nr:LysR family transcriptional regulator [Bifidobacterium eulemuris]OZG69335.1 transcriptional regulator [Bifidobacterium eulemuris]QOL31169.1 LysR family transcriptional regulator [Bifidobacterium eulemuris]
MELDQLRALDAIAAEGTLSAAAQTLRVSQPALSRSMQRLEAEFNHPLFDRTGRRITLNETGRTAVDWSRQILRDIRLMREAVELTARRTRTVRVGTVAPAPLCLLASLMMERFPQETLTSDTLTSSEVERHVADGTLDLGIIAQKPSSPALRSCELMHERLSVALPPNHPLAARESVTADQLDGETFLILTDIGFWRERVDRSLPHSTFIEQRDRGVFDRLRHSTPYCTFVTDAPFMLDAMTGRALVPIDDDMAKATFSLIIRSDAQGLPERLFDWAANRHSRQ